MGTRWAPSARREMLRTPIFTVVAEEWPEPKGRGRQTMTVLEAPEWVNVVAVDRRGRLVLIRQPRVGSRRVELEIPGGAVSRRDPSPLAAGKRELLEETGMAARRWISLGWTHPNPAFHRNHCHMFLALGARRVAPPALEFGERIAVCPAPVSRIPSLIARGRITHSLVIVALYAALSRLVRGRQTRLK